MNYRAKLDNLRIQRGLTLGALEAATGITKAAISNTINGKTHPHMRTQYRLARALGCSVEELGIEGRGDHE